MANRTKMTRRARENFLEELQRSANVTAAATSAGISRTCAYEHKASNAVFSAAWDEAIGIATDALEAEARRRAVTGVEEPVFYLGNECGKIRKYSDRMLEILLKGHRPEKFRERLSAEFSGPNGGPIVYSNLDRANRLAILLQKAKKAQAEAAITAGVE
jgi:hypothetical protein